MPPTGDSVRENVAWQTRKFKVETCTKRLQPFMICKICWDELPTALFTQIRNPEQINKGSTCMSCRKNVSVFEYYARKEEKLSEDEQMTNEDKLAISSQLCDQMKTWRRKLIDSELDINDDRFDKIIDTIKNHEKLQLDPEPSVVPRSAGEQTTSDRALIALSRLSDYSSVLTLALLHGREDLLQAHVLDEAEMTKLDERINAIQEGLDG